MLDIMLFAAQHGDERGGEMVLGPQMSELVLTKLIPLLTDDCVIVLEGGNQKGGLMKPNHPTYAFFYGELGPVWTSGIHPAIHSDDPLWQSGLKEKVSAGAIEAYDSVLETLIVFNSIPTTWDEMIERIQESRHDVTFQGILAPSLTQFALAFSATQAARDKAFARQAKMYAAKGKRVFIVVGAVHCINMVAIHNWPVIRYECSPERIKELYKMWYRDYALTQWLSNN